MKILPRRPSVLHHHLVENNSTNNLASSARIAMSAGIVEPSDSSYNLGTVTASDIAAESASASASADKAGGGRDATVPSFPALSASEMMVSILHSRGV